MLSLNITRIAKIFSLVKVSAPCVTVNAHLVAGAATHDCTGTCMNIASNPIFEKFTEFFLCYQ